MFRFIEFLISGCLHERETEKLVPLSDDLGAKGNRAYLRCKKCGNWKKKDLI